MAKKIRSKAKTETMVNKLADLSELAGKLNIPDDLFDGDLQDACDDDAQLALENIRSSCMLEKLEFLHLHGFDIERLQELIEESVSTERG